MARPGARRCGRNEIVERPYRVLVGDEAWRNGAVVANDDFTSFLHIDDAAGAALSALSWPKGPVNVVDDEPARCKDWLPAFAEAIGAAPPRGAARYGNTPGSMLRAASNAKARNELGWCPRYPTWRAGFRTLGLVRV